MLSISTNSLLLCVCRGSYIHILCWDDVTVNCFEQPSYNYRRAIKTVVPQVQYLDDEPLLDCEQQHPLHAGDFDEDWKLIDELVQEGMVTPEEKPENMPGISFILQHD